MQTLVIALLLSIFAFNSYADNAAGDAPAEQEITLIDLKAATLGTLDQWNTRFDELNDAMNSLDKLRKKHVKYFMIQGLCGQIQYLDQQFDRLHTEIAIFDQFYTQEVSSYDTLEVLADLDNVREDYMVFYGFCVVQNASIRTMIPYNDEDNTKQASKQLKMMMKKISKAQQKIKKLPRVEISEEQIQKALGLDQLEEFLENYIEELEENLNAPNEPKQEFTA